MFERAFMKFFKENAYEILRLYINQIGITIFSLMLYFSIGNFKNQDLALRLKIAISVFAMLFYFALLYTAAWDNGAKDKIRVDAGKVKAKKYKGALMSVFANVPNFILAGVCVITMTIYMSGAEGAISVSQVFNLFLRMTNAMYLGLIQGIFVSFKNNADLYYLLESIGYLSLPLLAILSTHIGYIMGHNNRKIFTSSKNRKNQ